jgi:hypothetical protein
VRKTAAVSCLQKLKSEEEFCTALAKEEKKGEAAREWINFG